MVPEKQRKNNHFDGVANEAYAGAGFVFFIAPVTIAFRLLKQTQIIIIVPNQRTDQNEYKQ